MPEVSVILPNYNHAPFLKQRIESILNQTFQDFELIILDDCSNDGSKDIIESYRSNFRVTHIEYNLQNSGSTFLQWEKGIALAKGRFTWIAESDDWCENIFLEELVPQMIEDSEIVISYCQSICVDNNFSILGVGGNNKLFETMDGKKFVTTHMIGSNAVYNASMAVFRKSAALGISREYKKFRYCGDWLFWTELAETGKVFMNGKCLNYFRKHGNDVSGKAAKEGLLFIEGKKIFDYICLQNNFRVKHLPAVFDFRIAEYIKLRKNFASKAIKINARNAMMEMDKNFHMHLFKYRLRLKLITIVNKLFR